MNRLKWVLHGICGIVFCLGMFGCLRDIAEESPAEIVQTAFRNQDPQNTGAKIQTVIQSMRLEFVGQQIFADITLYLQRPDKIRIVTDLPGLEYNIEIVNGEKMWRMSRLTGFREVEQRSPEWEQGLFNMLSEMPGETAETLYEKYRFVPPYDKDSADDFYYIECTPRRNRWEKVMPQTLKIRKLNLAITGSSSDVYDDEGKHNIRSEFKDYKVFDPDYPILLPAITHNILDQMPIRIHLKSVEMNIPIADSMFLKPDESQDL